MASKLQALFGTLIQDIASEKGLYNYYHKTGSGFIRERLMHIPEGCNALLAHSAVYAHHGRAELLAFDVWHCPRNIYKKIMCIVRLGRLALLANEVHKFTHTHTSNKSVLYIL